MKKINSVSIKGFRSLADVELTDLPNVAVMVGANGSGKSNFLRFFEMLHWMMKYDGLFEFVHREGGSNAQLHGGIRGTEEISAHVSFENDVNFRDYKFGLIPSGRNLVFSEEEFKFWSTKENVDQPFLTPVDPEGKHAIHDTVGRGVWHKLGRGHDEAAIVRYRCENDEGNEKDEECEPKCLAAKEIVKIFSKSNVHQFHDTSRASNLKKDVWDIEDNKIIRGDGGNLASILLRLEHRDKDRFDYICYQISRVLPNFDRFAIEEDDEWAALRWKAADSDMTFGANLTSDGSLRFFTLATLLHLPPEMLPDVIFLDEPELGLHPAAVSLLAGMIRVMSHDRQVILATQSPALVDEFNLSEILVLNLRNGVTEMNQLDEEEYKGWLEEYSTGDLWKTNTFGGTPWYA